MFFDREAEARDLHCVVFEIGERGGIAQGTRRTVLRHRIARLRPESLFRSFHRTDQLRILLVEAQDMDVMFAEFLARRPGLSRFRVDIEHPAAHRRRIPEQCGVRNAQRPGALRRHAG
jgi:hypothetical protein